MQFQVDGSLASRLHTVAAAEGRDLDDVLHEAIVERIMKEHAWLLEQLGKGPK